MLDPGHLELLVRAASAAPHTLTLALRAVPGDPLGESLQQVVGQVLAACGGRALLRELEAPDLDEGSALALTAGDLRVRYQAELAGPEREPFVELLQNVLVRPVGAAKATAPTVGLQVFIAAACPNCPRVVRAALAMAVDDPRVRVDVVDAQRHAALAQRHGIRSVPSCVVDGGLVLVGELGETDLRQVLAGLGTAGHRTALLRSLVEGGRFDEALAQIDQGDGLVHFVALWKQSTTGMRIGLLLMAEKALARDVSALDPCVAGLLPLLSSHDAALRGDSADLLGRIGSDGALLALQALRDDPDPDVADIVAEALEHNSRRNRPS